MNDIVWRRDEPESPCINICQIHPTERICIGCFRSIQEIGAWSVMSNDERREVMKELPDRAKRLPQRRGGRRARLRREDPPPQL